MNRPTRNLIEPWAIELQRFLSSGAVHDAALDASIAACTSDDLQALLKNVPILDDRTREALHAQSTMFARTGRHAEGTILDALLALDKLQSASQPEHLSEEARRACAATIDVLGTASGGEEALAPLHALILAIAGAFHRVVPGEDAADLLERSIEMRRRLLRGDPRTHEPALAGALDELAGYLRERFELERAGRASLEAESLWSALAADDPLRYGRAHAVSLGNLACHYHDRRDLSSALDIEQRLAELRRRVMRSDDDQSVLDLATTLSNLASTLRDLRRYPEAEKAFAEAIDLSRPLVEKQPGGIDGYLGGVLNNQGILFGYQGELSAALESHAEALRRFEADTHAAPERRRADVAMVLSNLGDIHTARGEFAEALDHLERAEDLYTTLWQDAPQIHAPALASTLNNLGMIYRDLRRFRSARLTHQRALALRRQLVESSPDAFNHHLASTLNNLGALFADCGEYDRAREAFEESGALWAAYTGAAGKGFEANVATAIANVGAVSLEAEGLDGATTAFRRALAIRQSLEDEDVSLSMPDGQMPEARRSLLAANLANLAASLAMSGEDEEAIAMGRRAVADYRKLVSSDPSTAHIAGLARALTNCGSALIDTGDLEEGRRCLLEAIEQVEGTEEEHYRYLLKGAIAYAYAILSYERCADRASTTFAYAAALRHPTIRSRDIERDALERAMAALAPDRTVLVATAGGRETDLSLGVLGADGCHWHRIDAGAWERLSTVGPDDDPHDVRVLAKHVWSDLPATLRDRLDPAAGAHRSAVLISADPYWSAFPWELIRFGDGRMDCLGLHHALARIGSILPDDLAPSAPERSPEGDRLAVLAPHTTGQLPLLRVEQEVRALRTLVPARGGRLIACETGDDATVARFREAILARPAVLHFSGHGEVIAGEEYLVFPAAHGPVASGSNKDHFGSAHLDELAKVAGEIPLLSDTTLVVMNSCLSGRIRSFGGAREDLVEGFLRHGAQAVIATAVPMSDSLGETFTRAFYTARAWRHSCVGEALVEARRLIDESPARSSAGNRAATWGHLHLYGEARTPMPFSRARPGSRIEQTGTTR